MMLDKEKAKILIVGLFPPPYSSGFRIINQYVADLLDEPYEVIRVDMSVGILNPSTSMLQSCIYYLRSIFHFFKIFTQVYFISRKHKIALCYLSPSSTKVGHIRDIIILSLLNKNISKIILNIQSGDYSNIFQRKWHASLTKNFIKRVSTAIFTSEVLKNRSLPFIGLEKCKIIRNTVDDLLVCNDEEVEEKIRNYAQKHNFNICYISNMIPTKGYMDLYNAIHMLSTEERQGITIDYVGEWLSKDQEKEFIEMIKENGLATYFKLHGKVNDRSRIKSFYLNADVFVLPTYFPLEAQPVSIIEALNAGVPVVTTRHASIPEFITHDYNGIMVGIKSPNDIKDALIRLKNDKNEWEKIARNARNSFNEQFSSRKVKNDWLICVNDELYNA